MTSPKEKGVKRKAKKSNREDGIPAYFYGTKSRHKAKLLKKRERWITKHFGEEILAGIEAIASNEVKKQVNRGRAK